MVLAVALSVGGRALAAQRPAINLVELSLEELLSLEVISAGKREQLLTEIPTAIHVITAEDIRRSQATTIPDLLRQVPGLLVAQEKTGQWAISIRGFNSTDANKLLVLLDGRTLYSPVYTGVEWDAHDTLLEDVDRIEIIRGPGASLWGANAVNGVINIITKDAADTQGGRVTYDAGRFERGVLGARYGGSFGSDQAQYRVYSKHFSRPSLRATDGTIPPGSWDSIRQGGRLDWTPSSRDRVSVSSEWSRSTLWELDHEFTSLIPLVESEVEEHDRTTTSFVTTQWQHRYSPTSELEVRFFHDRNRQYDASGGHDRDESIETSDIEFQHRLRFHNRHDLVWGGGFRHIRDRLNPALDDWFSPNRFTANTTNGFIQDDIALFGGRVRATGGSKFEWNAFSGAEVQPTARLLWLASPAHTVWTAVSRAVRVPARIEMDMFEIGDVDIDDDEVAYELVIPGRRFNPETLTAYESGYRFVTARRLSIDVASFYNAYDNLKSVEAGQETATATPIVGTMTPLTLANNAFGVTYGAEVAAYWTVTESVQLSGSYALLRMNLRSRPWSTADHVDEPEGELANNMFFLRSYTDLPGQLELNGELRFVGAIRGQNVPAYWDANVRASRSIGHGVRIGVALENLLHERRHEWDGEDGLVQSRSARARIDWRF
jgi:iron complex outermembrane receptor protein